MLGEHVDHFEQQRHDERADDEPDGTEREDTADESDEVQPGRDPTGPVGELRPDHRVGDERDDDEAERQHGDRPPGLPDEDVSSGQRDDEHARADDRNELEDGRDDGQQDRRAVPEAPEHRDREHERRRRRRRLQDVDRVQRLPRPLVEPRRDIVVLGRDHAEDGGSDRPGSVEDPVHEEGEHDELQDEPGRRGRDRERGPSDPRLGGRHVRHHLDDQLEPANGDRDGVGDLADDLDQLRPPPIQHVEQRDHEEHGGNEGDGGGRDARDPPGQPAFDEPLPDRIQDVRDRDREDDGPEHLRQHDRRERGHRDEQRAQQSPPVE